MNKILLVESESIVRLVLSNIIQSELKASEVIPVRLFDNIMPALAKAEFRMLIISAPFLSSVDHAQLKFIRTSYPDLIVFLLIDQQSAFLFPHLYKDDVDGIVDKKCSWEELKVSLNLVYNGTPYYNFDKGDMFSCLN